MTVLLPLSWRPKTARFFINENFLGAPPQTLRCTQTSFGALPRTPPKGLSPFGIPQIRAFFVGRASTGYSRFRAKWEPCIPFRLAGFQHFVNAGVFCQQILEFAMMSAANHVSLHLWRERPKVDRGQSLSPLERGLG